MKLIVLFVCSIICSFSCEQQRFIYKDITQHQKNILSSAQTEIDSLKRTTFKSAIDLKVYLPKGYSTKGDEDYTFFLQKGIDNNQLILMPNFPILINYLGLKLKSNSKILFQLNSKLIVANNDKKFYNCLNMEGANHIEVYFANLEGDRYSHKGKEGEWGIGIYMYNSKYIKFYKPLIQRFWGDGIYIGGNKNNISQNIIIESAVVNENRRNGISIISAKNLRISNSLIANTSGTSPEFGIDLEPNNDGDALVNVLIVNNLTYNNSKGGVLLALDNLKGGAALPVDIKIQKHTDELSHSGLEFAIDRYYNNSPISLKGKIQISDSYFKHNNSGLLTMESGKSDINLELNNIYINNTKLDNQIIKSFIESFAIGKKNSLNHE